MATRIISDSQRIITQKLTLSILPEKNLNWSYYSLWLS